MANEPASAEFRDETMAALTARVTELETTVAALGGALARLAQLPVAGESLAAMTLQSIAERVPPPPFAAQADAKQTVALKPDAPKFSAPKFAPKFATAKSSSLEANIGSRVLSKIAVVLLLVGAAWFLKWAFDNRWIGAMGRVLIGMAAGVGIILASERFRRTGTPSFSYSLKAIGSGVLYLSLWASLQLYHLVPAPVVFIAMLAVTAWNGALALSQDSRLLAAYALLGAYLTPVLLSTGGDHGVFLFSYLATIALAVAVLLRRKPWEVLLCAPVPVTSVFFVLWFIDYAHVSNWSTAAALVLLLWAVFAATPLLARNANSVIAGLLQPIAAALFAAIAMYAVLGVGGQSDWKPWLALAFAAVYLVASRWRRPSLLSAIHLSIAISFLTAAIPLKLSGHGITVGWMAEAIVVLALAATTQMEPRNRSALAWLGSVAMLLGAWGTMLGVAADSVGVGPALDRSFFTAVGACVGMVIGITIFDRMPVDSYGPRRHAVQAVLFFALNLLLLEAVYVAIKHAAGDGDRTAFLYSGWIALQGAVVLALGFWRRAALVRWTGLVLLAITLVKTVAYDMRSLGTGYRVVSFMALGVLLLGISYAYNRDWLRLNAAAHDDAIHEEESGQ